MSVYLRAGVIKSSVAAALLLGAMVAAIPSHAELIEDSKTVVQLHASDAHWISPPNLSGVFINESGGDIEVSVTFLVDTTGRINDISIIGKDRLGASNHRQITAKLKRARLQPFMRNGVAVRGRVTLPITIVGSEYPTHPQADVCAQNSVPDRPAADCRADAQGERYAEQ
ncbi:hypothetical protein GCM10009129_02700 [Psychrobacter aestuarii]|uniref:TonB C-terminal domain-containing protein n=1 Tax=Psychrobacter aestuarii TaxID=556327 RepID=A0ABN0VL13_9GAMM